MTTPIDPMVQFWIDQVDGNAKAAGVSGKFGEAIATAMGLTPETTQETKVNATQDTAQRNEEFGARVPSIRYYTALKWSEYSGIPDLAMVDSLLSTDAGCRTLKEAWRAKTDDAEKRKRDQMKARLEELRAKWNAEESR